MATTTAMICSAVAEAKPPHVAILPSPGIGHLVPLCEFAKTLVGRYGFTVTFITVDDAMSSKATRSTFTDALPQSVTPIFLPPPPLDDLPSGSTKVETLMCLTMSRSRPSLREILKKLKSTTRLVAFVTDLFGAETFDVAMELGVPKYVFHSSNAMGLHLFHRLRELDETVPVGSEYRDMSDPIRLPGHVVIEGRDFPSLLQERGDTAHALTLRLSRRYDEAEGIIINTSTAIEPEAILEFDSRVRVLPEWKVHPVGPLVRSASPTEEDPTGCLEWLGKQPAGSVLFVSFGSVGVLSAEQQVELAVGLEMSEQRFLWVVRSPDDLPAGFVERTRDAGVGFLVPDWGPQTAILGHASTGGFLTHCGWNSTLESLANGVPMIAWPLYAEQRMNAVMLTDNVKVAIRPGVAGDGLVGRHEISRVVRMLMLVEGDEAKKLRTRVDVLQGELAKCLAENGSSYLALHAIATKWRMAPPPPATNAVSS